MDPFIELVYKKERQRAYDDLYQLTIDWRKELWPDKSKDPIWRQEHADRVRRRMQQIDPMHAVVAANFGATSLIP